jgi:hypothetical protein
MPLNAMATSSTLVRDMAARREDEERAYQASGWRQASVQQLLSEAGDALVGIPRDAFEGRPLVETLARNNRLRGIGALLLAVGAAGVLLDFMLS